MTEPIKLPLCSNTLIMSGLMHEAQDYARLAVEQNTAELRAELADLLVSMEHLAAERDEARAEVLEQARLNGMGSEREARLMAQVQEARAELARLKEAIPAVLTHIDDIGARGYYSGKTLEEDAAIEVLRAALKEPK
jgi:hypothetical protein